MREILFKAKRIDNGEWVEGYVNPCVTVGKWHICRIEENLSTTQIEIDPNTICQYTGLTDKNGEEIYTKEEEKNRMLIKEEERRWIPLNEKIPKKRTKILLSITNSGGDCRVVFGWMDTYKKSLIFYEGNSACEEIVGNERVEAWMPLPEPYKGEKK